MENGVSKFYKLRLNTLDLNQRWWLLNFPSIVVPNYTWAIMSPYRIDYGNFEREQDDINRIAGYLEQDDILRGMPYEIITNTNSENASLERAIMQLAPTDQQLAYIRLAYSV